MRGTPRGCAGDRRGSQRALLAVVCALFSAALAFAASGRIVGMVVDRKGTGAGGARVKLVDRTGATVQETQSDEQGRFALDGIAPGGYELTAEKPLGDGFVGVSVI